MQVLRFVAYGPGGIDENGRHYYAAILQLQALVPHDSEIRQRFTRTDEYTMSVVEAILEDGIKHGAFRAVDPETTATALMAAIEGERNVDITLDIETAREATLSQIEQFVSNALVA